MNEASRDASRDDDQTERRDAFTGAACVSRAQLSPDQVAALSPSALAPAQIEEKVESAAVAKAGMDRARCFVLAMFAGAFIGMGGAFFGLVTADATLPFAATRVLGGFCFCLGLQLILCCGAELFTGNALMVCGLLSKKVTLGGVLANWGLVWLGNLAGSVLVALLLFLANLQGMNGGAAGDAFVSLAAGKATLGWTTVFFKGIMCNVLVCLAVWIGFGTKSVADKLLGIVLPITAFVAMGFEHCVANMFFFSMGLLCKSAGFAAGSVADSLTAGGVACNLVFSTLGNVIGGALLVGLGYWFAYHKRDTAGAAAK